MATVWRRAALFHRSAPIRRLHAGPSVLLLFNFSEYINAANAKLSKYQYRAIASAVPKAAEVIAQLTMKINKEKWYYINHIATAAILRDFYIKHYFKPLNRTAKHAQLSRNNEAGIISLLLTIKVTMLWRKCKHNTHYLSPGIEKPVRRYLIMLCRFGSCQRVLPSITADSASPHCNVAFTKAGNLASTKMKQASPIFMSKIMPVISVSRHFGMTILFEYTQQPLYL